MWSHRVINEEFLDDTSIHELFFKSYDACKHLSELPSDADEAQAVLKQLLRMLQRCDTMVDTTGLFSDNESKDDISTSSLRCAHPGAPASSQSSGHRRNASTDGLDIPCL